MSSEDIAFILRLIPFAVLVMSIALTCMAFASGDVVNFMKQALPVFGGLFIILVISQAMA